MERSAGRRAVKMSGRVVQITIAAFLTVSLLSGCAFFIAPASQMPQNRVFYRKMEDIPGVTEEEIRAISELREQITSLKFGAMISTEAFIDTNGDYKGFTILLCDWLSELFDIPFEISFHEWGDLLDGLESGEIDFTGELTPTDERRQVYFMTDAIAGRTVRYFRIIGSLPLASIEEARPLRYVFLRDTVTYIDVLEYRGDTVEYTFVDDYEEAHRLLKSGESDAFFDEGIAEAAFDTYGDIESVDFFPLIYGPVSLATRNPANEPIISVVQKALRNEGLHYLVELYNEGASEYRRHKLAMRLTEEEREFIQNSPTVKFAAEYDNYPTSFYNSRENEWQGICFDALREVEELTGLTFELISNELKPWPELLAMLESGEVSIISELIRTHDREGRFLWPETPLFSDLYALVSKSELRKMSLNEVWLSRVGVVKDTAQHELFNRWFPNHLYLTVFTNFEDAFHELQRGAVDLVMASRSQLMDLTHYQEQAGYKTNITFDYTLVSTIGFNLEEAVLCSIVDKALQMVDTKGIADEWLGKTYDYRQQLEESRRPWFLGVIVLLFLLVVVLVLLVFLINAGRKTERFAMAAELREKALVADNEMLDRLNRMKNEFFQDMSHDFRTPLTVISTSVLNAADMLDFELDREEMRESLSNAQREIMRMARMVESAMRYSSLQDNRQDMVEVDIAQLLNEAAETYRALLERQGNALSLDIPDSLPSVYGNVDMLLHVMSNLMSNANRYTRNGEVTISARCVTGKLRSSIVVAVKDNGEGVKPALMPTVFDRGVSDGGTGLGLSICKTAIEAHDGTIGIDSKSGVGTTIWFSIPMIERRLRHEERPAGEERRAKFGV